MADPEAPTRIAAVVFLAALGLLCGTIGVMLLAWAGPEVWAGERSRGFEAVAARVEAAEVESASGDHGPVFAARVRYVYDFEARPRAGSDHLRHGDRTPRREEAEAWLAACAPGAVITAYVDPGNPDASRLCIGVAPRTALAAAWAVPALACGAVALVFAAGKARSTRTIPTDHAPIGPLGLPAGGLMLSGAAVLLWTRGVMTGWCPTSLWSIALLWAVLAACWLPLAVTLRAHAPWRWM